MKKISLLALVFALLFTLQPTAEAVVIEFGGGTGFEKRGGDLWGGDDVEEGFYQYDFRPHLAFFLNHNTTLGAYFNLSSEDYSKYSLLEIELGPRIGYYFKQYGSGYPYIDARISLGNLFYNSTNRGSYSEMHVATAIGVGYLYLLNQNVGLTGSTHFEQHFYDKLDEGWISGNKLGFQLGLKVFIY